MSPDQHTASQPVRLERTADAGALIKARRREQSLRIDDAAALSGVSVDLLSRLENGKGSVRFDKLLAVLDGLGLALVAGPKDHPSMQPPPVRTPKRP
jgi:transcriptional regulator with XRE-family HTH domain